VTGRLWAEDDEGRPISREEWARQFNDEVAALDLEVARDLPEIRATGADEDAVTEAWLKLRLRRDIEHEVGQLKAADAEDAAGWGWLEYRRRLQAEREIRRLAIVAEMRPVTDEERALAKRMLRWEWPKNSHDKRFLAHVAGALRINAAQGEYLTRLHAYRGRQRDAAKGGRWWTTNTS
jgi:hypothetical protein